ncbi:MAG: LEA14-like dessication related protein [Cocleimonas sp.]|jgi:LEA14-like dessication related protein
MNITMIKRIHPATLLILFLSVWLSACSSGGIKGIAESPTVQVHKVEMGNFNLSGGNATFILNITNPNSFPIPLTGFDYGLRLNGIEVANGIKEQRVTIGAKQSTKLEVPLSLSFSNMLNMLPNLLRTRQVDYSLGGRLHFPWIKIPFQRTGGAAI